MSIKDNIQKISVIVPKNPFVQPKLQNVKHCVTALNVEDLMKWWPGTPHTPHRNSQKVKNIQRSLDWKRVVKIASYLLQKEIIDAPNKLDKYFRDIYQPKKMEPGRQWPPKVPKVVGFARSGYPTFSNVLLHVNGAKIEITKYKAGDTAKLSFDQTSKDLHFSVIDGQHRINGAYFAIKLLQEERSSVKWEIPVEIFLDLDALGEPPRHQAQIFIDVNYNQKKVDKSLVADLFPTARGDRTSLDDKERAQDIGRKLMLETGPLVGMIQIPGIKFGVTDVVTLATLNSAIENVLDPLKDTGIKGLEEQTIFLAQCLDSWLDATGRKHDLEFSEKLDPENVAYQGRVLVSFLTLLPACIWTLEKNKKKLISTEARTELTKWLRGVMLRAGLLENKKFIAKRKFKERRYLGTGGTGKFRDSLWAASLSKKSVSRFLDDKRNKMAIDHKSKVLSELTKV